MSQTIIVKLKIEKNAFNNKVKSLGAKMYSFLYNKISAYNLQIHVQF